LVDSAFHPTYSCGESRFVQQDIAGENEGSGITPCYFGPCWTKRTPVLVLLYEVAMMIDSAFRPTYLMRRKQVYPTGHCRGNDGGWNYPVLLRPVLDETHSYTGFTLRGCDDD
jgi:hypothetical protein